MYESTSKMSKRSGISGSSYSKDSGLSSSPEMYESASNSKRSGVSSSPEMYESASNSKRSGISSSREREENGRLRSEIEKLKSELKSKAEEADVAYGSVFDSKRSGMSRSGEREENEKLRAEIEKLKSELKLTTTSSCARGGNTGVDRAMSSKAEGNESASHRTKSGMSSSREKEENERLRAELEKLKVELKSTTPVSTTMNEYGTARRPSGEVDLKLARAQRMEEIGRVVQETPEVEMEYESAYNTKSSGKRSSRMTEENERLRTEIEKMKSKSTKGPSEERDRRVAQVKRVEEIKRIVREAQEVDLAFLFDATSSMQDYMDIVKERMRSIAESIAESYPEMKMRVGFVFYRDYEDYDSCGRFDFTSSFQGKGSEFVKALAEVEADGGGDTAEDVFSGLEELTKLKWRARNRVVYHLADAPCHGNEFHDRSVDDDYPNGDPDGRSIQDIIRRLLLDCQLSSYSFLHLNNSTRKMLQKFSRVAKSILDNDNESGDASTFSLRQDEYRNSRLEDIPRMVVTACKESISHSMQSAITTSAAGKSKHGTGCVPREVRSGMPDWGRISAEEGQVYRFKWYPDLDEVLGLLDVGKPLGLRQTQSVKVQISPYPFSKEGAMRWPFYARMVDHEYETRQMVVKRFKDRFGVSSTRTHEKEKYVEQMEVQAVSAHFAQEFNSHLRKVIPMTNAKEVTFTDVSTLQVAHAYYNMEKMLSGMWTKYNNNAGYVREPDDNYIDMLQTFSHWTHERSNMKIMVTDLQGVKITSPVSPGPHIDAFLLCDPAIHSVDVLRFTGTNLGEKGFELFYKSHVCNNMCHKLGLKRRMSYNS